jgi:hypothetical protein
MVMKSGELISLCERFGGVPSWRTRNLFRVTFGRDFYLTYYCYFADTVPGFRHLPEQAKLKIVRDPRANAAYLKLCRKSYGDRGGLYRETRAKFYSAEKPGVVVGRVLAHLRPQVIDTGTCRRVETAFRIEPDGRLCYYFPRPPDPSVPPLPHGPDWKQDAAGVVESWLQGAVTDGMLLDWVWDEEKW